MKTKTRIEVLAKCYMKAKRNSSDGLNHLAIDISTKLKELEKDNPEAAKATRETLKSIGYYK